MTCVSSAGRSATSADVLLLATDPGDNAAMLGETAAPTVSGLFPDAVENELPSLTSRRSLFSRIF